MRIVLELREELVRAVAARVSREGSTLSEAVEEALGEWLSVSDRASRPFRLNLLTMRGEPLPGVDIADRNSLYCRMERES